MSKQPDAEAFLNFCDHAARSMRYWVLGPNHEIIPATMAAWSMMFGDESRRVAATDVGEVRVSTVFLGIDHGHGMTDEPLLFETMVFGGPHDGEMDRYATWDEAMAGHAAMVAKVLGGPDAGSTT